MQFTTLRTNMARRLLSRSNGYKAHREIIKGVSFLLHSTASCCRYTSWQKVSSGATSSARRAKKDGGSAGRVLVAMGIACPSNGRLIL